MKAHDLDGNQFDISREEAERIAEELAKLDGKETNKAFLNRALDNIEKMTGHRPKNEDEAKEILHNNVHLRDGELNLIYETVEAIVGWHSEHTKSM